MNGNKKLQIAPPYNCPSCRTIIPKLELTPLIEKTETILDTNDCENPEFEGYIRLTSSERLECDNKIKLLGGCFGCLMSGVFTYFIIYYINASGGS